MSFARAARRRRRLSRKAPRHGAIAGFTLIEVLIALAIVGLALAAAVGTLGNGVSGHAAARDIDTALALAEGKIAQAGITEPLLPSRGEGEFAGRFAWRRIITPYDDEAAGGHFAKLQSALRLYRVEVTVAWYNGHRPRRLALATLRLGPPPP